MHDGRLRLLALVAVLALPGTVLASCGENGEPGGGAEGAAGTPSDGGEPDAFYPEVEPTDPCLVAGLFFDGESDCNVVRCPELTCECPLEDPPDAGTSPPTENIIMNACVPGAGCLDLIDCTRLCEPALALTRQACEARIAASGAVSCTTDDDCLTGECREESLGSICVDALPCSEDGHCSSGAACLFDPDLLDSETSFPTAPGTCADGYGGSLCFEDDDCVYGTCLGERCTSGLVGDSCTFGSNCASGFCRIPEGSTTPGTCVSGEPGAPCVDDGDCSDGLHCTSGACYSDAVGQSCDSDAQCESGVCVSGLCRSGRPGSRCEEDGDCLDGFCVGGSCASGTLWAPCSDADDCATGLQCARGMCSDGAIGAPCGADADCAVLACVNGTCSDGANGSECESGDDCTSGRCVNPAGVEPGECTSGAPGSLCILDSHCVSDDCSSGRCN